MWKWSLFLSAALLVAAANYKNELLEYYHHLRGALAVVLAKLDHSQTFTLC